MANDKGIFEATWMNELTGEKTSKNVKFTSPNVRMADTSVVDAEVLVKIANGGNMTKAEKESFPQMVKITKDQAAARISTLAQMNYGYLEEA